MLDLLPGAQLAEIEDSGRDLTSASLERRPQTVADFLARLDR
jgi:hypothetical protein